MDYNKVEMDGRLVLELLDSLSPYTSADEARMIYNTTSNEIVFGNEIGSNFRSLIDVPRDSIILLESNTAVTGYSLLTDQDDDVIYITRGSGAGGEQGGSQKSTGSWDHISHTHSMSNHTHGLDTHTHSLSSHYHAIPNHSHQYTYYTGPDYAYSWDVNGNLIRVQDYGYEHAVGFIVIAGNPYQVGNNFYNEPSGAQNTSTESSASGPPSGSSTAGSPDTTGSGVTPNTWRPTGRNFTRQ
jgi:hypothetical protein